MRCLKMYSLVSGAVCPEKVQQYIFENLQINLVADDQDNWLHHTFTKGIKAEGDLVFIYLHADLGLVKQVTIELCLQSLKDLLIKHTQGDFYKKALQPLFPKEVKAGVEQYNNEIKEVIVLMKWLENMVMLSVRVLECAVFENQCVPLLLSNCKGLSVDDIT